jgi:hypothetical protein
MRGVGEPGLSFPAIPIYASNLLLIASTCNLNRSYGDTARYVPRGGNF